MLDKNDLWGGEKGKKKNLMVFDDIDERDWWKVFAGFLVSLIFASAADVNMRWLRCQTWLFSF